MDSSRGDQSVEVQGSEPTVNVEDPYNSCSQRKRSITLSGSNNRRHTKSPRVFSTSCPGLCFTQEILDLNKVMKGAKGPEPQRDSRVREYNCGDRHGTKEQWRDETQLERIGVHTTRVSSTSSFVNQIPIVSVKCREQLNLTNTHGRIPRLNCS